VGDGVNVPEERASLVRQFRAWTHMRHHFRGTGRYNDLG